MGHIQELLVNKLKMSFLKASSEGDTKILETVVLTLGSVGKTAEGKIMQFLDDKLLLYHTLCSFANCFQFQDYIQCVVGNSYHENFGTEVLSKSGWTNFQGTKPPFLISQLKIFPNFQT